MMPLRRLHTTGKTFCPSLFDRTLNTEPLSSSKSLLHEKRTDVWASKLSLISSPTLSADFIISSKIGLHLRGEPKLLMRPTFRPQPLAQLSIDHQLRGTHGGGKMGQSSGQLCSAALTVRLEMMSEASLQSADDGRNDV